MEERTHLILALLFFTIILLAGCTSPSNDSNNTQNVPPAKVVAVGDRVHINYIGYITNADGNVLIFDKTPIDQPAEFQIGVGELIPGFDQGVLGMREGEFKKIIVPSTLGYGEQDPTKVIQEGIHLLQQYGYQVKIAEKVKTTHGNGVITAIDENAGYATVNYNNPLAGKTLYFEVTVVKIIK